MFSPVASQRTSLSHPRWSCRCRAVRPQRRWCAHTGRSPAASVHLVYTLKRCLHSHSATDREGNHLLYTTEKRGGETKRSLITDRSTNLWNPILFLPYLHVKQRGAVSGPLLDEAHVIKHGLMRRHSLQPGPLLQNAGPCGGCLLLHPHLQHLLLLHLQQRKVRPSMRNCQTVSQADGYPVCLEIQLSIREPHRACGNSADRGRLSQHCATTKKTVRKSRSQRRHSLPYGVVWK